VRARIAAFKAASGNSSHSPVTKKAKS
jgi:hypothetical protein